MKLNKWNLKIKDPVYYIFFNLFSLSLFESKKKNLESIYNDQANKITLNILQKFAPVVWTVLGCYCLIDAIKTDTTSLRYAYLVFIIVMSISVSFLYLKKYITDHYKKLLIILLLLVISSKIVLVGGLNLYY